MLMHDLAQFAGEVLYADIEEFAQGYLTDEARESGYTEEDYEEVLRVLTEWKERYFR